MEHDLRMGLSFWTIAAIVCNSAVGVLIVILFVILYKACKVPSHQDKVPVFVPRLDQKKAEQKYMLAAAWLRNDKLCFGKIQLNLLRLKNLEGKLSEHLLRIAVIMLTLVQYLREFWERQHKKIKTYKMRKTYWYTWQHRGTQHLTNQ